MTVRSKTTNIQTCFFCQEKCGPKNQSSWLQFKNLKGQIIRACIKHPGVQEEFANQLTKKLASA